jgi:hypothetical protein
MGERELLGYGVIASGLVLLLASRTVHRMLLWALDALAGGALVVLIVLGLLLVLG